MTMRSGVRGGKGELQQLNFEESNTDDDSYTSSHHPSRRSSQPKVDSYSGRPTSAPAGSSAHNYEDDSNDTNSNYDSRDRRGSAGHEAAADLAEISEGPLRNAKAVSASQDRTYGYVPDSEPLSDSNLSVQRKNKSKIKQAQQGKQKNPPAHKIPSPPTNRNSEKKAAAPSKKRLAEGSVSDEVNADEVVYIMEAPREFEPLPSPKKSAKKISTSPAKAKGVQSLDKSKVQKVDMATNTYPSHLSPNAREEDSSAYSNKDEEVGSPAESPKRLKKRRTKPVTSKEGAASSPEITNRSSHIRNTSVGNGQGTGIDYDRKRPLIVYRKRVRGTKATYPKYFPRKLEGGDPSLSERHGTASENLRKRLSYDAPTAAASDLSGSVTTKRPQNFILYGGEEVVEETPEGKYYVRRSLPQPYSYAHPHGATLGQIQGTQFPALSSSSSAPTNVPRDETDKAMSTALVVTTPAAGQQSPASSNTALSVEERVAAKRLELAERSKEVMARREAKRLDVQRQAELLESERRYWGTKHAFERQQRIIEKKIYLRELTALWAERTDRSPYWLDELAAMGLKDEPRRRRKKGADVNRRKKSITKNDGGKDVLNANEDPADDAEKQLIAKYKGLRSHHPLDNDSYDNALNDDGAASTTESEQQYLESITVLDDDGGMSNTEKSRLIAKLKRRKGKGKKGPQTFEVENGESYPEGEIYTQVMVDDDGTTRTVTATRRARQEVSIQTDEIRRGDSDWFYLYEGTSSEDDSDDYEYEVEYSIDNEGEEGNIIPKPKHISNTHRVSHTQNKKGQAPSSPIDRARIMLVSAGGTRYDHNGRPQPRDDMIAEQQRARELQQAEMQQISAADPQSARRGRQSPNAMYIAKDKYAPPTSKDGTKEHRQAVAIFSRRVSNPHRYREGIVIRYEPLYRDVKPSHNIVIPIKPPADTMSSPHRPRMGKAFLVAHPKQAAQEKIEKSDEQDKSGVPDVPVDDKQTKQAEETVKVTTTKAVSMASPKKPQGGLTDSHGKASMLPARPTRIKNTLVTDSNRSSVVNKKAAELQVTAPQKALPKKELGNKSEKAAETKPTGDNLPPISHIIAPIPSPAPSESPKTPTTLPSLRKPPAPPPVVENHVVQVRVQPSPTPTVPYASPINADGRVQSLSDSSQSGQRSPPRVPLPPSGPPPQLLAKGVEARRKNAAEGFATTVSSTPTSTRSSRPPSSTPKTQSLVTSRHQSMSIYPSGASNKVGDGSEGCTPTTTGLDNPSAFTAGQLARQLSIEREKIEASERRASLREETARQRRLSEQTAAIEELEQLMAERERIRLVSSQQAPLQQLPPHPPTPKEKQISPLQEAVPSPSSVYDNSRLPSRSGLKSRERGASPTNRVQFSTFAGESARNSSDAAGGELPLYINNSFAGGGGGRVGSAGSSNGSNTLPPFPLDNSNTVYNDYSAPIYVPEEQPAPPIVPLHPDLTYEQKVAAELERLREEQRLEALRMEEDDGL